MKKLINISLALILMLSLVACGVQNTSTGNDAAGTPTNNTSAADQTQPEPEKESEENAPADSGENTTQPSEGDNKDSSQPESNENAGDGGSQPEEDPVAFSASHSDVTFKVAGSSFRLTAQGNRDEYSVTYFSADESVATVDEDGNVTAVSAGTTTVTMHIEVMNGSAKIEYDFPCIIRCVWSTESTWGDEGGSSAETPAANVDLAAFFASFVENIGGPSTMAVEGEILDAYYAGLSGISCKQMVVQMAAISSVPFEFALLELENATDAEAAAAILRARVAYQVEGGAWYPETIAAWEKAEVIVKGNYVAMIVAGEATSDAVAAFNALFS